MLHNHMYYVITSPLCCTGSSSLSLSLLLSLSGLDYVWVSVVIIALISLSHHVGFVVITPLQGFGGGASGSREHGGDGGRKKTRQKAGNGRHQEGIWLTDPTHLHLFKRRFTSTAKSVNLCCSPVKIDSSLTQWELLSPKPSRVRSLTGDALSASP